MLAKAHSTPAARKPESTPRASRHRAGQRAAFDRHAYLIIRGALTPDETAAARKALDRIYASQASAGLLGPDGSMHLLSAAAHCPEIAGLTDHPATFGLVWSLLGWNIHIYHSHLDVHPPIQTPMPSRFNWHQDGGRQSREIETTPRPRLSVKIAYWPSDVSQPGRGNLKLVPGRHLANWIDGPPRRNMHWPDPSGAIEVTAAAEDAVLLDRGIWHTRYRNSPHTRKAVFFGYTYRWAAIRDDITPIRASGLPTPPTPSSGSCSVSSRTRRGPRLGPRPGNHPAYGLLNEQGFLDPANPPVRP